MAEIVIVASAVVAVLVLVLASITLMRIPTTRRVIRSQQTAIRSAEAVELAARKLLQDFERIRDDR